MSHKKKFDGFVASLSLAGSPPRRPFEAGNKENGMMGKKVIKDRNDTKKLGTESSLSEGRLRKLQGNPELWCGCTHCTDTIWNENAAGFTCGSRISWLRGQSGSGWKEACAKVALEFPTICGACDPTCDDDAGSPVEMPKPTLFPTFAPITVSLPASKPTVTPSAEASGTITMAPSFEPLVLTRSPTNDLPAKLKTNLTDSSKNFASNGGHVSDNHLDDKSYIALLAGGIAGGIIIVSLFGSMLYFLFRKRKRKQHYQLHNDDINKIPERTCTKSLSQSEFEVEPSDKKVLSNEETYWANTALGDSAMQSPSIDGEALEVDGSSIISNDFESEASSYDYDWSYQSGTLTMSQLQDRFENENETKSNISVQDEEEDDSLWSF